MDKDRIEGSLEQAKGKVKEVAGSGGIYRHNYENVQSLRIWRTIHEALPALRAVVDAAFQA